MFAHREFLLVHRKAFIMIKNLSEDSELGTIPGVRFWSKADLSAASWS